jgi:transglutaminase-like putative cysteine protease
MSASYRRVLGVVLALLFAFGIPLFFRSYFGSQFPVSYLLVPVGVTVGGGLVRRMLRLERWWVTLVALLPPVAFAAILLVGILITPFSSYAIWLENVARGSPSGSVSVVFQLAFGFFASVISPLFLTMGFLFPLALLASSVAGLLAVVFQTATSFGITIGLLVVSLIVLMARWTHRGHRFAAVLFYLTAFAACIGAGRLVMGGGQPHGSRVVDETLYPALRQVATDVIPALPLLYEIPGYGFSFSAKQLGGPTALSSRGMFTIKGRPGSTVYLRTVVYDYYDGKSWGISDEALKGTDEERQYYAFSFYKKGTQPRGPEDLELTVEAEYYSRLPTTMDTVSLSFPEGVPMVDQGNMNTGISLKRPIKEGEHVVIHRRQGSPAGSGKPVPWLAPGLSALMRNAYTQVPQELPQDVRDLAEIINPDVSNKEAVLENIRQFLAIKASYNLRPTEDYEAHGDFVAGFLLSRDPEGYCVHFATSFVILARLAGIPARYATGFLVYFPEDTGTTEIRGFSSHAWPEVWVDGKGWVTYEATAAVDPRYYDLYGDALQSRLRINLNRSTEAQIAALLGRRVTEAPGFNVSRGLRLPSWAVPVGYGVLAAALLALAALLASGKVRYLFLSDLDKYRFHLRRMLRRVGRDDLPDPARVGWVAWWETVERRAPEHAEPVRAARNAALRVIYWEGHFRKEHLEDLRRFRKRYERELGGRRSARRSA